MGLHLPKKTTFWTAVGIAGLSIVLYIFHLAVLSVPMTGAIGYAVLMIAFILLCLGVTLKGS